MEAACKATVVTSRANGGTELGQRECCTASCARLADAIQGLSDGLSTKVNACLSVITLTLSRFTESLKTIIQNAIITSLSNENIHILSVHKPLVNITFYYDVL